MTDLQLEQLLDQPEIYPAVSAKNKARMPENIEHKWKLEEWIQEVSFSIGIAEQMPY
jgi:hypothetical protein